MRPLNIAVVGAGISGLSAAWLLSKSHRVTLFEQNDYLGGHAHTVEAETASGPIAVDTGFIVFNQPNYPNLTALFAHLSVDIQPAEMTFALTLDSARLEYSGTGINGFFGQRRNLFKIEHWKLLSEINRFFDTASKKIPLYPEDVTLGEFLSSERYSQSLIEKHIAPMAAAIWSSNMSEMLRFPARAFVTFYANHAMLSFLGRGKWHTVTGGSREYVRKLRADADLEAVHFAKVRRVMRRPGVVHIEDGDGVIRRFDHVVMATHADEALELLADPDGLESEWLGSFGYQRNIAILHRDARWMPSRKRLWSAWNYVKSGEGATAELCVTYWMNALQSLKTDTNLFVTLNPPDMPHPKAVIGTYEYEHPIFDHVAMQAQRRLWSLQGKRNTWFCGAYFGYGFHEDGLQSGLAVAEALGGVKRPWEVPNENGRIAPMDAVQDLHQFRAAE